jgi:ribosomal protein S18 acetylase RimI-like enzyme
MALQSDLAASTGGEPTVRVAGRHDLPHLQALYRQLAESEYALDVPYRALLRPISERAAELLEHLSALGSDDTVWLVVDGAQHVIGSVSVREAIPSPLVVPVMEIRDLVVERNHRRRGIGRLLLEHAFAWGRERGMRGAMLEVADANAPALRLYEAQGMYPSGRVLVRDL